MRRGVYRGLKQALSSAEVTELQQRVAHGEPKAQVARAFGVSRETLYQYLRRAEEMLDLHPHPIPDA